MIELMNIINSVADSNVAYYALIGVLVIVVLSMIYLIYSQNKEMEELQKEKDEIEFEMSSNDDMVEEIATNVKDEKDIDKESEDEIETEEDIFKPAPSDEELYEEAEVRPVDRQSKKQRENNNVKHDYEWLDGHREPTEAKNLITEVKEKKEAEPVIIKEITDWDKPQINKVHTIEEVDLPREKKLELIDATLTNIPNLSLLDATMTDLPNVLDYDFERDKAEKEEDLLSITRELELAPKERIVKMTDYEKEQEKKAIISYDELLDHKDEILADIEEEGKAEPTIEEFQPEENVAISIDEALENKKDDKETVHIAPELEEDTYDNPEVVEDVETTDATRTDYEYEENFLAQLKSLQSKLN